MEITQWQQRNMTCLNIEQMEENKSENKLHEQICECEKYKVLFIYYVYVDKFQKLEQTSSLHQFFFYICFII